MNLQPTYALGVAVGVPGMIASEEKCNKISRTVESAAGIAFGQPAFQGAGDHGVVVGGAFAATGAGTADASNVGTTTITASPAVAAPAQSGRYIVEQITAGATGVVHLIDPTGVIVGDGVVGTPFTLGGIGPVTLTSGGSPAVGDRFYIDVTYTANNQFVGLAVLNSGVPTNATTPDAYPQYYTGAFMTMGVMDVVAGGNVAKRALVYWDPATSRYVSDATKIRIPNTVFDSSGVNGDIVRVATRLR